MSPLRPAVQLELGLQWPLVSLVAGSYKCAQTAGLLHTVDHDRSAPNAAVCQDSQVTTFSKRNDAVELPTAESLPYKRVLSCSLGKEGYPIRHKNVGTVDVGVALVQAGLDWSVIACWFKLPDELFSSTFAIECDQV